MPSKCQSEQRKGPSCVPLQILFFYIIPFVNGEGVRMERARNIKNQTELWTSLSLLIGTGACIPEIS